MFLFVLFYGLRCSAVGRTLVRQRSVLWFSANRVWLVSRFHIYIKIFGRDFRWRVFLLASFQLANLRLASLPKPWQSDTEATPL